MFQRKDDADEFSDDDFETTIVTSKQKSQSMPRTQATSITIPYNGGILRHYIQFNDQIGFEVLADDVAFPSELLRPDRALPVFVGLLSLAAARDCRILSSTDLKYPR